MIRKGGWTQNSTQDELNHALSLDEFLRNVYNLQRTKTSDTSKRIWRKFCRISRNAAKNREHLWSNEYQLYFILVPRVEFWITKYFINCLCLYVPNNSRIKLIVILKLWIYEICSSCIIHITYGFLFWQGLRTPPPWKKFGPSSTYSIRGIRGGGGGVKFLRG